MTENLLAFGQRAGQFMARILLAALLALVLATPVAAQPLSQSGGLEWRIKFG